MDDTLNNITTPAFGRLFTEAEAAMLLGITPAALAKRRLRGQPPDFCRMNRTVRYSEKSLVDFVAACTVRPRKPKGARK